MNTRACGTKSLDAWGGGITILDLLTYNKQEKKEKTFLGEKQK